MEPVVKRFQKLTADELYDILRLRVDVFAVEAQTYARGLYEKAGFRQVSEEFLEDGIPHIRMRLELPEEEIR